MAGSREKPDTRMRALKRGSTEQPSADTGQDSTGRAGTRGKERGTFDGA